MWCTSGLSVSLLDEARWLLLSRLLVLGQVLLNFSYLSVDDDGGALLVTINFMFMRSISSSDSEVYFNEGKYQKAKRTAPGPTQVFQLTDTLREEDTYF